MAVKRCGGCGSQMNSHMSVCPSCGRGAWLNSVVQTAFIVVLVLGVTFATGLVRWEDVERYFPFRNTAGEEAAMAGTREAPPPPQPARARARSDSAPPAGSRRTERLGRAVAAMLPCIAPDSSRRQSLANAHPDWDDRTLGLVACGEVRNAFTAEQAREALGVPDSVERDSSGREVWIYPARRVVMAQGRVVAH